MATSLLTPAPADRWWMRQPGGQAYGPVGKAELDRWYAEGRISPQCQVLYEPQQVWRWAAEIYPALAMPPGPLVGQSPGSWQSLKAPSGGPGTNPMVVVVAVVDLLMGLFQMAYSLLLIVRSLPFLVIFSVTDVGRAPNVGAIQSLTMLCVALGVVGLFMGAFALVCAYATSQKRRWGRMANYGLAGYFVAAAILHAVANGMFHLLAACMLMVVSIAFAVFVSIVLSLPQVSKEFE
jgi:hypothetical protein